MERYAIEQEIKRLDELSSKLKCNLVQHRHQLGPSERNARRVRDVISLLEEYGGMA
jgi:hypothetical protein